jgi:transcriptional regulator GlxA family with amidase domain
VRTFTRRFREETGVSPGRWLTQQRVEHARRLLETTDLPVPQVAERAGFGTAVSLRQHLQTAIGVSPGAYRRTFRAAPAAADAG